MLPHWSVAYSLTSAIKDQGVWTNRDWRSLTEFVIRIDLDVILDIVSVGMLRQGSPPLLKPAVVGVELAQLGYVRARLLLNGGIPFSYITATQN